MAKSTQNSPLQIGTIDYTYIAQNSLVAPNLMLIDPIESKIWEMAEKYGIDYDLLYDLMICESRGKTDAVGDSGLAFGLYQWHYGSWYGDETWIGYAEIFYNMFSRTLERDAWFDQIEMTAFVLSVGDWQNWTNCYLKI